jgi:hypothetical protein
VIVSLGVLKVEIKERMERKRRTFGRGIFSGGRFSPLEEKIQEICDFKPNFFFLIKLSFLIDRKKKYLLRNFLHRRNLGSSCFLVKKMKIWHKRSSP